jgi:uncharacterized protein
MKLLRVAEVSLEPYRNLRRVTTKWPIEPWKLLVIGLVAGIASGGLGVGGGIVLVPMLLWAGLNRHSSHATSLASILPIAAAGALSFGLSGEIDLGIGVLVGLGGVVGSAFGATVMNRSSPRALTLVFDIVLLVAAIRMMVGGDPVAGTSGLEGVALAGLALVIGAFAGFFAGLAGVGGGVVIVPAMVLLLGLTQHQAQGTSLVAIIFTALSATVVNLRNERVRISDGLLVGAGGVVGSLVGSQIALRIEGRALSWIFALLVLYVAGRSLYRTIRTGPAGPGALAPIAVPGGDQGENEDRQSDPDDEESGEDSFFL